MTITELASSVNKAVYFVAGDLKFTCMVTDARMSWGKPQFQIRPVAGTGTRWVEFSSIEPIKPVESIPQIKKPLTTVSYSAKLVLR